MKKSGFTLAEILIALMILGVIAALIIPSIIGYYTRLSVEASLKKNVALLTNAINLAIAETGESIDDWTIDDVTNKSGLGDGVDYFIKYIAPHMSVTKYLDNTEMYERFNAKGESIGQKGARIILNDGTGIAFWWQNSYDSTYGYSQVSIDVNGPKPPNSYGKDYFLFEIYKNSDDGNSVRVSSYPVGSSKNTPEELESVKNLCYNDPNPSMVGAWCGGVIVGNGYKIPDDYPWLR